MERASSETVWRISLLGGLRVERPGEEAITRFRTQKTAGLLAFLALERGRRTPRERLLELFWARGGLAARRNSLSKALSSLRRQLEPPPLPAGSVIRADHATVELRADAVATDVAELESALATAERSSGSERRLALERAAELHVGPLLPECYWDFAESERAAIESRFAAALHDLVAGLESAGETSRAIELARRGFLADSTDERACRDLMRLCAAGGDRGEGLRAFKALERALAKDLGARASADTRELARRLESRAPAPTTPAARAPAAHTPDGLASPRLAFLVALDDGRGGEPPVLAFGGPREALAAVAPGARAALEVGPDGAGAAGAERARRLLLAAREGQVLASERAAPLLREALESSLELADVGLYRLAGASEPERIFERRLKGAKPSLAPRATPALATSLPAPLTRFFGREAELARIAEKLDSGTRLLTITGIGGTGKTRLALEAARREREGSRRGVVFVPLAEVRDGAAVPKAVALALRLDPRSEDPLAEAARAIGGAPLLLVLDNLEQLSDAGSGAVADLVEALPTASFLATTRVRLKLAGEVELALRPLPAPRGAETRDELVVLESVRLFLDRAQAARPDFQVTARNAAAIASLCHRLEGIPLALELAASRAQLLTPEQMVAQLSTRLDAFPSRQRGATARHRTLRAAIEGSHDLLGPELRLSFARLSVFRGGFSVAAAAAVCGVDETAALETLAELRDASLVLAHDDAGAEARFGLLESIREFAAGKLSALEQGEAEAARRHAGHFAAVAESVPKNSPTAPVLDGVARDMDNLRAAIEWAASATGDAETGLRIVVGLESFVLMRGYLREAKRWLERLLARTRARTGLRARALNLAARITFDLGDSAAAVKLGDESILVARESGDRPALLRCLNLAAGYHGLLDQHEAARAVLVEARGLARELGDRRGEAITLYHLGLADGNDLGGSRALLVECVALLRGIDDPTTLGHAVTRLSHLETLSGNLDSARALLDEALEIWRAAGAVPSVARVHGLRGGIALGEGELERAWEHYEEARALVEPIGERTLSGWLHGLGLVAVARGDDAQAQSLFDRALALFQKHAQRTGAAEVLRELGALAARAGDRARARRCLLEALDVFIELDERRPLAIALERIAQVAADEAKLEVATRLLATAGSLRDSLGTPPTKVERRALDSLDAALRKKLGARAHDRESAAGRKLGIKAARGEARRALK